MNAWVILVQYNNGDVNISQDGYEKYEDVVREIITKNTEYLKQIDDYNFIDTEYNISYTIKSVFIK